tara:strand:+ start:408 stop:758 length:351 start_codon:yes stop_codon:yes gene_type:complete
MRKNGKKMKKGNLTILYNVKRNNHRQLTIFRMLRDEEKLYLFYGMEDKYLKVRETKRDIQPYFNDCVELFLISAPDNFNTHFGFELNLNKASNKFIFFNDFYNGKDPGFKGFNPES